MLLTYYELAAIVVLFLGLVFIEIRTAVNYIKRGKYIVEDVVDTLKDSEDVL